MDKTTTHQQDMKPKRSAFLWRGFGLWNLYFIAKLGLYWGGYIKFHVLYNCLFAAALLLPLAPLWLHRLRHVLAIPAGIALLYYDSWLPPIRRLLDQPEVLQFSNAYLIELLGRFINWDLVAYAFIVFVAYLFLAQWLRITTFTVLALAGVALTQWGGLALPRLQWSQFVQNEVVPISTAQTNTTSPVAPVKVNAATLSERLNAELEQFYQAEKQRRISFESLAPDSTAFDLLFLNICSLSWDDLKAVGLSQHPLFAKMDVIFENFNSATSYSGPAVSRLMHANCGQLSHADLYEPVGKECSLFSNLEALGFDTEAVLNHNGKFQNFIDDITQEGSFSAPIVPTELKPTLRGFDHSPIWSDYETLALWLDKQNAKSKTQPAALLYNTITLHDGNREATADGGSRSAPYDRRAQRLLDELDRFMDQLERSGRKAVVVFIPEHGAALQGDKMQISGMREIPTTSITHVPVGVRLIGEKSAGADPVVQIQEPTSFLAVSDLVSRLIHQSVFDQDHINWQQLTADLQQTAVVSENEGTVVMEYEGVPYVRLDGKNWLRYQQ
ncbi:MAG TPA: cellulose biosynthesis protein BcsG [Paenalcaligenes hominis]|uniref:Cellulose biosynthesis protein BcsG n=1 Tax=Paenalcaligenes hominis TaxID=643674 RepID=A0A9D2VHM8_9BURK|nr:cellulose biosynthesis protein BcsG [Paenalcaligenes hominis]